MKPDPNARYVSLGTYIVIEDIEDIEDIWRRPMGWEKFLLGGSTTVEGVVLPWLGGRVVAGCGRRWRVVGGLPIEHGWHRFEEVRGREVRVVRPERPPDGWQEGWGKPVQGYVVGDRLIPDGVRAVFSPVDVLGNTVRLWLAGEVTNRFCRAAAVPSHGGGLLFVQEAFPLGPEADVEEAFVERRASVDAIKGVTPALHSAFLFEALMRDRREARARAIEEGRRREEEERRIAAEREEAEMSFREAMGGGGSSVSRRATASVDFALAARQALAMSGAELLDERRSRNAGEMVVQFRFRERRFECVVERDSLHVVDAGICLEGNDRLFTLESLPLVIDEGMRTGRLHVFRRI